MRHMMFYELLQDFVHQQAEVMKNPFGRSAKVFISSQDAPLSADHGMYLKLPTLKLHT